MSTFDRRGFLQVAVVVVGAELVGCGTTPDTSGGGGGSGSTGGSGGTGGGAGATGGGSGASGGGTAASGGGSGSTGGGTSASGGGSGATGGGTSASGGGSGSTGGGTSATGGGSGSNACTAPIVANDVATLGTGPGILSPMHAHSITIALVDITTGTMKDYTNGITGGHTHSLKLSAADFTTLMSGGTVTKSSNNETGDATTHSHMVRLTCV